MIRSPQLPQRDDDPEKLLIGELLRYPASIVDVPTELMPEDFSNREHSDVYHAIRLIEAAGETPSIQRVAAMCAKNGSQRWAREATQASASEAIHGHARYNGQRILEQAKCQRFALMAVELQRMACEGATSEDLQRYIESKLEQSHGSALSGRVAYAVGQEFVAELRAKAPPANIWTGLESLDGKFGGWSGGELVTIGAPSSGGKSAFALQVARHNADKGRPILFFTCEMRDRELIQRILCGEAKVDSRRIRAGLREDKDIDAIERANERTLRDRPLVIVEASGRKIEEICATAKYEAAKRGGMGLVVVDYLQILAASNSRDEKRLQVAHITASLKRLAQALDCCVLALSQLNREGANGGATMTSFAESAYIERDSDICAIIEMPEHAMSATFRYVKFRAGERGAWEIGWSGRETRFFDLAPEPVAALVEWRGREGTQ